MEKIGEYLKQEREKKNITLEQVSRDTKISKSVLYAIESDSFEDLPGGFFNIGILRTYSKYIGIDDNKVVSEYKKKYERISEKPFFKEITKESIGLHLNKKILIIVFLLILIISLILWFFHPVGISNKEVVSIGKTIKNPLDSKIKNKKLNSIKKEKSIIKKVPVKKRASENQLINRKILNIVLYFNEQCWIEIKKGENTVISKLFQPGEKYSVIGNDFTIKLGNPSAVQLMINGEKGFINSKPGIPVTFKLNIDNYKQYLKQ